MSMNYENASSKKQALRKNVRDIKEEISFFLKGDAAALSRPQEKKKKKHWSESLFWFKK